MIIAEQSSTPSSADPPVENVPSMSRASEHPAAPNSGQTAPTTLPGEPPSQSMLQSVMPGHLVPSKSYFDRPRSHLSSPEIVSPGARGFHSELTEVLSRNDDDSVREFVIRDVIMDAGYAGVYFLSLDDGADPSDDFLGRFADLKVQTAGLSAGLKVQIRKNSWSRFVEPLHGSEDSLYFDRFTNEPGHRLNVKLQKIANGSVKVEGNFHTKALDAFGNGYIFEKTDTRWRVLDKRKAWVS
jgi:hypothetical protein